MAVRIHVMNDPSLSDQFRISEQQVWEAIDRCDPSLAMNVAISVGGLERPDDQAGKANVLIGWAFPADAVAATRALRWVHVIGAGTDHLEPFDWLPTDVQLTNSSGVHVARAGEFAACCLLMLNGWLPAHVTEQRAHRWTPRYSSIISGKTVTVVGLGAIGGEVARRAKELGLHVRGVRRTQTPHDHVDELFAPEQIHAALDGADFVTVCAALTPETRGLISVDALDCLPSHAGVINIAREPIVDYRAVAAALRAGRLGGAILDVFEPEPLGAESDLWDCPGLLVTPHISSDPIDYTPRMLDIFVENLARFASGSAPLRNLIAVGSNCAV